MRHIKNLHGGNATLVRPYEYVVGRLSGTIPESDPLSYRHYKKGGGNNMPSIKTNSIYRNNPTYPERVTSSIVHEGNPGYVAPYPNTQYYGTRQTSYRGSTRMFSPHNQKAEVTPHDTIQRLSERKLKLREFEILAKKYYYPDIAQQMILNANMQANILEDDDSLDKNLEFLRNMDRGIHS
jgi:hypothetical protein